MHATGAVQHLPSQARATRDRSGARRARPLAAAAGESSLAMVTFANQAPGTGTPYPTPNLGAPRVLVRGQDTRNALNAHQLSEHLANLAGEGDERLFVITPDAEQPAVVSKLGDPRLVWFSFRALYDAISQTTIDPVGGVSEQNRFLLRELGALQVDDGLVDNADVVVVAARFAYPEYLAGGPQHLPTGAGIPGRPHAHGLFASGEVDELSPRCCGSGPWRSRPEPSLEGRRVRTRWKRRVGLHHAVYDPPVGHRVRVSSHHPYRWLARSGGPAP